MFMKYIKCSAHLLLYKVSVFSNNLCKIDLLITALLNVMLRPRMYSKFASAIHTRSVIGGYFSLYFSIFRSRMRHQLLRLSL